MKRVPRLRFDADVVVHGSANPLLATEIAFSCLHGNVAENAAHTACGMSDAPVHDYAIWQAENLNRFSFCLGTPRFRQLNAISAASRNSAKR